MAMTDVLRLDDALSGEDVSDAEMRRLHCGSCRMMHLEAWFRSWVPDSVCCARGGRSSVETWYSAALDIEEVVSGAFDSPCACFCC